MPREMTIIGGGIQGTTLALALAGRGVSSLIVEKEDRLLSQASLRNEGKLHLGFVYALDPTGLTTGAMVEGALTFSPLLERWCGELDWRSGSSKGFGYVVMEDSPPSTPGSVRQTVRTSSTGWVRAGSFLRL
jgi:glycine/D-amino acid oxidase-like deaminating enzyme